MVDDDYNRIVTGILRVCIGALDSQSIPDGRLRDLIEQLAIELSVESVQPMVNGMSGKPQ